MDQAALLMWLRQCGADVLAPTNPFEVARFRARGGVHVIYTGRRGIKANGFGSECLSAFEAGRRLSMGITTKPRTSLARLKAGLAERDGLECFYCGLFVSEADMTIEHLVSRHKGGPDHMDNLVLAHEPCNKEADNLPLVEKIKLREKLRAKGQGLSD